MLHNIYTLQLKGLLVAARESTSGKLLALPKMIKTCNLEEPENCLIDHWRQFRFEFPQILTFWPDLVNALRKVFAKNGSMISREKFHFAKKGRRRNFGGKANAAPPFLLNIGRFLYVCQSTGLHSVESIASWKKQCSSYSLYISCMCISVLDDCCWELKSSVTI